MPKRHRVACRVAILCALFLVVFVPLAAAQYTDEANLTRGFNAGKVYDFLGMDTVERFSGNLTLRIPLGDEYRASGKLPYQFVLHYNSHVWNYQSFAKPATGDPGPCGGLENGPNDVTSFPDYRSNAGLGWRLSFGSLGYEVLENGHVIDEPYDYTPNSNIPEYPYFAGDGGKHDLVDKMHAGDDAGEPDWLHRYSIDNSYIRATYYSGPGSPTVDLDFPGGTRQTFMRFLIQNSEWQPSMDSHARWRLWRISDPFGNRITFTYSRSAQYAEIWKLQDGDRTHWAYFKADTMDGPPIFTAVPVLSLDHLDLEAFGGARAIYRFRYTHYNIPPGGGDTTRVNPDDPTKAQPVDVPLLLGIDLPDGRSYDMGSAAAPSYDVTAQPNGELATSGGLTRLGLPTGGALAYVYGVRRNYRWGSLGPASCRANVPLVIAVAERHTIDAMGHDAAWTYKAYYGGGVQCAEACNPNVPHPPQCAGGFRDLITTAQQPDGGTSIAYFTLYNGDDECDAQGWEDSEYGQPLTRRGNTAGPYYPSTEFRSAIPDPTPFAHRDTLPPPPTDDPLFRRAYVQYEGEPNPNVPNPTPDWGPPRVNMRSKYDRTEFSTALFDPDTNQIVGENTAPGYKTCGGATCFTETRHFLFDGFGHYRQSSTTSNIPTKWLPSTAFDVPGQTPAFQTTAPSRTTFVNHPGSLDLFHDWILNTPTERCVADDETPRINPLTAAGGTPSCSDLPGAVTTSLLYDRNTGALEAQRVIAATNAQPPVYDVLTRFEYDRGLLSKESYYGGNEALPDNAFGAPFTPQYEIQHQHTFNGNGMLQKRTSFYTLTGGVSAPIDDATFDLSTGKVAESRDSAGLVTKYMYDPSGRLRSIAPQTSAPLDPLAATTIEFVDPAPGTTTPPPQIVTLSAESTRGAGRFVKEYHYDGLGRVILEKTLMPDAWSQVATAYNDKGQLSEATTQQDSASFNASFRTQYFYDAAGGVTKVIAPDGGTTYTSHNSAGHALTIVRDHDCAPSDSCHTILRKTQDTDAFGRLFQVTEPSGPTDSTNLSGSDVTTAYGYDVGDRLGFVDMDNTRQTRSFDYDRRGFLKSEKHPESGLTAYGDYDARGHAHSRIAGDPGGPFDLAFEYDKAERLTAVNDLGASGRRPLKSFAFLDSNTGAADYSAGKLHAATRHNYLSSGDATVTETFTYGGAGGAVSRKETSFSKPGMDSQTFTSNYTYNDFGLLASLTYPTCLLPCGTPAIGILQRSFSNGRLSRLSEGNTVFADLTYSANGMIHEVKHQGGVIDTYEPDPTGMARPASITTGNFVSCPTSAAITIAGCGSVLTASVPTADTATYTWSIDNPDAVIKPLTKDGAKVTVIVPVGSTTLHVKIANACGTASSDLPLTVGAGVLRTDEPADTTAATNELVTLRVTPQDPSATYQWFQGLTGDKTHPVDNQTNPSFTAGPLPETTSYWVRATTANGCAINSRAARITIDCPDLAITQQPHDVYIAGGTATTLTVAATGSGTLTYQWYRGKSGDKSQPIDGATTASHPTGVLNVEAQYWVQVTNGTCSRNSTTVTVHVCNGIRIVAPPAPQFAPVPAAGQSVTLTTVVKAEGNYLSYVWTVVSDPDATPGAVIGQSSVLTRSYAGGAAAGARTYRVTISSADPALAPACATAAITLDVTFTLYSPQLTITAAPQGVVLYPGTNTFPLNAAATDGPQSVYGQLQRKWYHLVGDAPVEIPDTNVADARSGDQTLATSAPGALNALYDVFWCVFSDQFVSVATPKAYVTYSNSCPVPTPTVEPSTLLIKRGVASSFTVTADWPGLTYQWYEGMSGDTTRPVDGGTGAALTVTAQPTHYWCRVTNACATGKRYRDSATVSVAQDNGSVICPPVTFTQLPPPIVDAVAGAPLTLVADAGNTAPVQFVWVLPEGTIATGNQVVVHPTETATYRLQVINTCTDPATAFTVKFLVRIRWCGDISIAAQPQNTTLASDGTTANKAHLQVDASPATVAFTWYAGEAGDTGHPVAGSDGGLSPAIDVNPSATTAFWARLQLGSCAVDTTVATVTVCQKLAFTVPPHSGEIRMGDPFLLSALATGIDLTYEWHQGTPSAPGPIIGTNSSKYLFRPQQPDTYYLEVRSACETIRSDPFFINVCAPPTISAQPQSISIFSGKTATLSVTATSNTTAPLTYQWWEAGVAVTTASTASTFTTPALTSPHTYYVRVTDGLCYTDSDPVTVSICELPEIIDAGAPFNTSVSQPVTLMAAAGSGSLLTWYQGHSGDVAHSTIAMAATTSTTLTVRPATSTTYWASVTHGECVSRTSDFVVNVCIPAITQPPTWSGNPIAPGSAVPLSVQADSDGVTYQWYTGASGNTSAPIANATAASITVNPLATTTYWVRATGTCGHVADSAAVTVVVCQTTTINSVSPSQWVSFGSTALLSVSASGTNLTYQWYIGNPGDTTHPIANATIASYAATPASTTTYWVSVNSTCGSQQSQPIVVSVCSIPTIKLQPQSVQIYSGGTATLSVSASATTTTSLTYQWFRGSAGDTSTPVGSSAPIFTTPALSATTSYWVRVSHGTCAPADSQAAIVTVNACPASIAAPANLQSSVGQTVTLTVPASVTSPAQRALALNGSSYARIASSNALDIAGPLTVEAWIKISATGTTQGIIERVGPPNSGSGGYALRVNAGKIVLFVGYDSSDTTRFDSVSGATTLSTGQWHHVAGVYDGSQLRVYLDGVPDGSKMTSAVPGSGTADLIIGSAVNGSIDEARLSADALYADTFAPSKHPTLLSSTRGLWSFDAQTLADSSTNALNGTAVGSPAFGEDVPGAKTYTWYSDASGDVTHPLSSATPVSSIAVAPTSTTSYWYQMRDGGCTANSAAGTVSVCVPQFTQQPAGTGIIAGQSTTLSATADTSGLTYQWYVGSSGTTSTRVSGGTGQIITVSSTTTTSYWVRATGSCGRTTDSATATVTVCQPPTATMNTVSQWISRGQSLTLTVSATGTNLSYQWYTGASGDTTAPISGATQATYAASPLNTTTYWARVSSTNCSYANSAAVTVSVCATPTIATQPASVTIYSNTSATLSVAATEATTTPIAYQWYQGSANDTTHPVGTNAATFTTPSLTAMTSYWVRLSNGSCSPADSAVAAVSICPFASTAAAPADLFTTIGQAVNVSSSLGSGYQYLWYQGAAGDISHPLTGWTTNSYVSVAPTTTTQYWYKVTNGSCTSSSGTGTVYVCVPQITTNGQPRSQTVASGTAVTLSVTVDISGLTYQWYSGASGNTATPVSGATASTLSLTATSSGSYWVRVTSSCNRTVDSATAVITVCATPTITGQPQNPIPIASGQSVTLNVSATGSSLTYQWYLGQSGDTSSPVSGAASASMTTTVADTRHYWVRVTDACSTSVNSNAALVSVFPTITAQPQSASLTSGSTATLRVSATGSMLHYQWTYAGGGAVSGAPDAPVFIMSSVTAPASIYCHVSSGSASVNSNTATLSLCTDVSAGSFYVLNNGGCNRHIEVGYSGAVGSFAWYRGPRGDTTNLVSTDSTLNVCISGPTTYWVRLTSADGACYADSAAVNVQ